MPQNRFQLLLDSLNITKEQESNLLEILGELPESDELQDQLQDFLSLKNDAGATIEAQFHSPSAAQTFVIDPNVTLVDQTLILPPEEAALDAMQGSCKKTIQFPLFSGEADSDTMLTAESSQENQEIDQKHLYFNYPKIGRYFDLNQLGEGGMGEVRRVFDEKLRRTLAMKIIHSSLLKSPATISRFIGEAQVGAQLQHPNIIPVHEFGQLPDGRHYFTMKEIKGRELTEFILKLHKNSTPEAWITTTDGISLRRLITIFEDICEAIAYAHSGGVLHRDLKPENIMIGEFGEVLIVDWGIAKLLSQKENWAYEAAQEENLVQTDHIRATRNGSIAGTPSYMSPEQANGWIDKLDVQSDIYSLGAILYEILSGQPPYTGETALDVVQKVRNTKPRPLQEFNILPTIKGDEPQVGKIPVDLIQICEKAMARKIRHRYSSAQELLQEIRNWLEGAQKKEKALNDIQEALKYHEKSKLLEKQKSSLWQKFKKTPGNQASKDMWAVWKQGHELQNQAEELRKDYQNTLVGALVHSPDLEEAHQYLAELLIPQILLAIAKGNNRLRQRLERTFERHLQYVSEYTKQKLWKEVHSKQEDPIYLKRLRYGGMIGREALTTSIIQSLIQGDRLISLVGTAGVGKTRLVLEITNRLHETNDNIYFCDLTGAHTAFDIIRAVAKSLDIRLNEANPIQQLSEYLKQQETIMILDNVEQVIQILAEIIDQWLEQLPPLKIILTSRIKLNIPQEKVFSIQPLNELDAIELFSMRGHQANEQFSITDENQDTILRIINQLDRLPLAIELAAARLNIFDVQDIEKRLQERFSLLRSRKEQSQTLHTALDWSWNLLTPWSKAVLSQASLFRGGFSITAAEDIFVLKDWDDAPEVFDILQDLFDNSLIRQDIAENNDIRYTLLESVRQYSFEKLSKENNIEGLSGREFLDELERRHAHYYSHFGKRDFLASLDSSEGAKNWKTLFIELDNLKIATQKHLGDLSGYCCIAALTILKMKGPVSLGLALVKDLLNSSSLSAPVQKKLQLEQSKCLRILGRLDQARENITHQPKDNSSSALTTKEQADQLIEQGNIEASSANFQKALEYYQQAHKRYHLLNDKKGIVNSQKLISNVRVDIGDYQTALQGYKIALDIAVEEEFTVLETNLLANLGMIYRDTGHRKKALKYLLKALEKQQRLGNKNDEAVTLGNISVVYRDLAETKKAIQYSTLALQIHQEIGHTEGEAGEFVNLGLFHLDVEEFASAEKYFNKAIALQIKTNNKYDQAVTYSNFAALYRLQEQYPKSLSYYHKSLQIHRSIGNNKSAGLVLGNIGMIKLKQRKLEEARFYLKKGILLCQTNYSLAADIFTSNLAFILAVEGKKEQALQKLEKIAESFPKYPAEYGEYCCIRARILHAIGEHAEANRWLQKSQNILSSHPTSELKLELRIAQEQLQKPFSSEEFSFAQSEDFLQEIKQLASDPTSTLFPEDENISRLLTQFEEDILLDNIKEAQLLQNKFKALILGLETHPTSKLFKRYFASELHLGLILLLQNQEHSSDPLIELNIEELLVQAKICSEQSEYIKTIQLCQQAFRLAVQDYNALKALGAFELLIVNYQALGEAHFSVKIAELGIRFAKLLQHERIEASILSAISLIHVELGDFDMAFTSVHKALKIYESCGDTRFLGLTIQRIGTFYFEQANFKKALEYFAQALPFITQISDHLNESNLLYNIGLAHHAIGDRGTALGYYDQALEKYRASNHKEQIAGTLGMIGSAYAELKQYKKAEDFQLQSLSLNQEIGYKLGEGIITINLGSLYLELNKIDLAIQYLREGSELCSKIFPLATGTGYGMLAEAYARKNDFSLTADLLEKAEQLTKGSPNENGQVFCRKAIVLLHSNQISQAKKALFQAKQHQNTLQLTEHSDLGRIIQEVETLLEEKQNTPDLLELEAEQLIVAGEIEHDQSFYENAKEKYQKALKIYQKLENPKGIANVLGRLAATQKELGKKAEALENYHKALDICRLHDLPKLGAYILKNIAIVLYYSGEIEKSLEYEQQALELYQKIGDKRSELTLMGNLGGTYFAMGNLIKAKEFFQRSLQLQNELNEKSDKANNNYNLALVYHALGNHEKAEQYLNIALKKQQQIGSRKSEAHILGALGVLKRELGQIQEAQFCHKRELSLFLEMGHVQGTGLSKGNLANTYLAQNNHAEAKRLFQEAIELCDQYLPYASGSFRGSLATIYAQEKDKAETFALLKKGAEQVQAYPMEYVSFLCNQVKALWFLGELEKSKDSLNEAKKIFAELNDQTNEFTKKLIAESEELLQKN